jgi:uncharacterized DUF497 family protein
MLCRRRGGGNFPAFIPDRTCDLEQDTPEAYTLWVKYVFDRAKDAINRAKHGISLALAEILFAEAHAVITDDRFDYGEVRQIAFGQIGGRHFVCVYVDRATERRVISLRKANKREVKRHGQTNQ